MVSLVLGNGPPLPDASTDDAGAFAFHDLKPGQYQLGVARRDYPEGKTIIVSPSENPDPIKIELIPGAIVSGRILDEDGDPLYGCGVQARRAEHPEQIIRSERTANRANTACSGSCPENTYWRRSARSRSFNPGLFRLGPIRRHPWLIRCSSIRPRWTPHPPTRLNSPLERKRPVLIFGYGPRMSLKSEPCSRLPAPIGMAGTCSVDWFARAICQGTNSGRCHPTLPAPSGSRRYFQALTCCW